MLAAHNHAVEKDRKHHHYLKGSLYCGRCGSRMSLIHAKGNGGTYPYFFCIARMKGTGCEQPYVPVELVERAVESAYAQVRLPAKRAQLVRVTLDKALDLLANCERSYRKAPGHLRRQWNQALFERLLVHDDRIDQAEVAEPFATLANPELPLQLGGSTTDMTAVSSGSGSNEALVVGWGRFELPTSASRTQRSAKLSHHPVNRRGNSIRCPASDRFPFWPRSRGRQSSFRGQNLWALRRA